MNYFKKLTITLHKNMIFQINIYLNKKSILWFTDWHSRKKNITKDNFLLNTNINYVKVGLILILLIAGNCFFLLYLTINENYLNFFLKYAIFNSINFIIRSIFFFLQNHHKALTLTKPYPSHFVLYGIFSSKVPRYMFTWDLYLILSLTMTHISYSFKVSLLNTRHYELTHLIC